MYNKNSYLNGDIWRVSAVHPPKKRFLLTNVNKDPITKISEKRERHAELTPLIFTDFFMDKIRKD